MNCSYRIAGIAVLLVLAAPIAVICLQNRPPATRAAQPTAIKPADLVLQNGKIVTVDEAKPQVQAMAVSGDTIVALGTTAEIRKFIGPKTNVIDLKGALAVPGLIDAHVHFTGVGQAAMQLRLAKVADWEQIVSM